MEVAGLYTLSLIAAESVKLIFPPQLIWASQLDERLSLPFSNFFSLQFLQAIYLGWKERERKIEGEREKKKKKNGSRTRAKRIGWTCAESEQAAANQAALTAATRALSNNTATYSYCMAGSAFAAHQQHNTSNAKCHTHFASHCKMMKFSISFSFFHSYMCFILKQCKPLILCCFTWLKSVKNKCIGAKNFFFLSFFFFFLERNSYEIAHFLCFPKGSQRYF